MTEVKRLTLGTLRSGGPPPAAPAAAMVAEVLGAAVEALPLLIPLLAVAAVSRTVRLPLRPGAGEFGVDEEAEEMVVVVVVVEEEVEEEEGDDEACLRPAAAVLMAAMPAPDSCTAEESGCASHGRQPAASWSSVSPSDQMSAVLLTCTCRRQATAAAATQASRPEKADAKTNSSRELPGDTACHRRGQPPCGVCVKKRKKGK